MTAQDDMPWWVVRRGADDEAAFVDDVSGALYVPSAAPEIRMFAEVMAVLDIPSHPRGQTVTQRLEAERERVEASNVIPLRRLAFVRSVAAVGVAAALGLGLVTVSAYANVLPDGIQKVAHSVINAPPPKHSDASPGGTSNDPQQGNSNNSGNTPASTTAKTNGSSGQASGASTHPGHQTTPASAAADVSSSDVSTTTDTSPTDSKSNNGHGNGNGNGHGHKTTPTPTPPPS